MPHEEAESSTSARGREAPLGSSARIRPLVGEKDPPPYGAQHRQDAIWEGGNEALPSELQQFKVLDGTTQYQDDAITIASVNRPLPGVRLDHPGDLAVSGCEWHISPLGRSYFVNHNTRTTSWKKPIPERPAGGLMPECIIGGHSRSIWSLACVGASCNVLSASNDCLIRQWKIDGESVGKPLDNHGIPIGSMAVSPDETVVVSGSIDGRSRLWNIKKGSVVGDPWEGHNGQVRCLDWSPNALEIASGSSDGTIRRWNPDTGRQIAPPIETGHGWVYAVKYSPQGDKFTSGGEDGTIRVWSKNGELLIEIKGHEDVVTSLCWSRDGAYLFSASYDGTIRKWRSIGGKELAVFHGHANAINSFCLSPDQIHLVSASKDCSVRIWDLRTNQPVGDPLLHDDELLTVAMSSDGKYIASAGLDTKVYIWNVEAALKQQGGTDDANAGPDAKFKKRPIRPLDTFPSRQLANNRSVGRYGNDFFGSDRNHGPAPPASALSLLRRLFRSPRAGTRPPNSPQSTPREPRRWNFNLFRGGSSIHTVEVAAGRKKNRIYVSPPSAAELARAQAAALAAQHTNGSSMQAGHSQAVSGTQVSQGLPTNAQPGQSQAVSGAQSSQGRLTDTQAGQSQAVPGTQGSQGQTTGTQGAGGGMGDVSYQGLSCCGFFFEFSFGRRRPTSHQS